MKSIVIGYDETAPARRALEQGAALAKAFGAKVIVTSVAHARVPAARGVGPVDPIDSPALHEKELEHASAFMAEHGVVGEYDLAVGDPAEHIVELAEDRGADLIIVGTHEPGFVSRLLGLSVSESVQRKAGCDVLIVH